MIPVVNMIILTNGTINSATYSYLGPVHTAWGITSPKKRTAVTEIMIAHIEGKIESKKIGRASMAHAFESSRVTSKK